MKPKGKSVTVPAPGPPGCGVLSLSVMRSARLGAQLAGVVVERTLVVDVGDARRSSSHVGLVGRVRRHARERLQLIAEHRAGRLAVASGVPTVSSSEVCAGGLQERERERRAVLAVGRRARRVGRHERRVQGRRALGARVGVDGDRLPVGRRRSRSSRQDRIKTELVPSAIGRRTGPASCVVERSSPPSGDQSGSPSSNSAVPRSAGVGWSHPGSITQIVGRFAGAGRLPARRRSATRRVTSRAGSSAGFRRVA